MSVSSDPDAVLSAIRQKHPSKPQDLKGQVRELMPVLERARDEKIPWKSIHEGLAETGLTIDFQLLSNYVCALRKEGLPQQEASRRKPDNGQSTRPVNTPEHAASRKGSEPAGETGRDDAPGPEPPGDEAAKAPPTDLPDEKQIHSVETLGNKQPVIARRPK